jgi:AICAR transformylase/IMP cyclohydrolase PurH
VGLSDATGGITGITGITGIATVAGGAVGARRGGPAPGGVFSLVHAQCRGSEFHQGQQMVWHLKYGLNPHQGDAHAAFPDGREWMRVLNGQIGYVNLLDALRAWHLAQGGSANDTLVTAAANEADIAMVHTGLRLFWH